MPGWERSAAPGCLPLNAWRPSPTSRSVAGWPRNRSRIPPMPRTWSPARAPPGCRNKAASKSGQSQILLGKPAELVGNRAGLPERYRRIADGIPAEAIADPVDGAVGGPARHTLPGAGAPRLIREAQRQLQLHVPALLEMRNRDRQQRDG